MKRAKFRVEGMNCDGCALIIQSFLEKKPGVRTANILFKYSEARILYDIHAVAEDKLAEVIEKAGYRVASKS